MFLKMQVKTRAHIESKYIKNAVRPGWSAAFSLLFVQNVFQKTVSSKADKKLILRFLSAYHLKNAISSVPATMRQSPAKDFLDSFSLNTTYENSTVTTMLSLSIGTTTVTSPFCMA